MPPVSLSEELQRNLPTPVRRLRQLESSDTELWIKDDGWTGISYGGNKLRKLAPILAEAQRKGCRRLVTFGAAGSHHVLATALYGRRAGLRVAALMFPQWSTEHVADNLRAAVGLGLEVLPMGSARQALAAVPQLIGPSDLWIGPGAMGNRGAQGFAQAAHELDRQRQQEEVPMPDVVVLAVGSGSSMAGLLVGSLERELPIRWIGVAVNRNPAVRPMIVGQALALLRSRGPAQSSPGSHRQAMLSLSRTLRIDDRFRGAGYGVPTSEGYAAMEQAERVGLRLDHTYTAKAFACALAHSCSGQYRRVLFWNTLSAPPLLPLLAAAPAVSELPRSVRKLLIVRREATPR